MCQENGWKGLSLQLLVGILTDKERYNPLDYFGMRILEEIRFFFLDVEDRARNQKLCAK